MKKHLLLLALFILLGFSKANCQTQTPDWAWARSAQNYSSGWGEGLSVATDKSNNLFITGYYISTITFGSFILNFANSECAYLTKYDLSGNVKWAESPANSTTGYSRGNNVCTDLSGNTYLTGYFADTISFGSYMLESNGNLDCFLVKYDSAGNFLWARSSGGTGDDVGYGVSTDLSGNVYITGNFQSPTITFGTYTLTNAGSSNIFIVKYDSSGNVQWAKSAGGSSYDEAYSITTDALANVFITGSFSSPIITFGSYTLTNAGFGDIFLAKYDSSGNVLWAKSAGGTNPDNGVYVAADSSGNGYLTGYYQSPSITFGSYTLTNAGNDDAFLAKYDSSGNVSWARNIGGTGTEYGYCVTIDKSYKVYVTGGSYPPSPLLTFDTITLQLQGNDPMFIAGCDSSGNALWVKSLGSGGDDNNAVAASPSGCIYIGGDFETVNSFIIGSDSLVRSGIENVFVAKLCYSQSGESVPEISTNQEFILYPNPFEDMFTASPWSALGGTEEKKEYQLTLYDVFGQVLLRRSFANSATINTEQLARGMYFYEIEDKDGVGAREKAVKQ